VLAVLAAATLPLASNVLYAAGVRPHPVLDPTPVVWSVAAAGVAASLFRSHFLDLLPMARASAFRAAADAIVVVDGQGRIVDHNAAARSLFVSTPPPDDASTDATADPIGAEATAALVAPIAGVLTDGEGADDPVDRECTVRPSAGGPSRQYLVGRRPVVAGQADRGVVLTATDITTQKRQQQRLSRQNKRLDQFASIVSHDLRNPLGVADGFTDLARERLGAADDDEPVGTVREDVDAHLDRVARAVDRMDVLVEDVLTLARQGQAVTDVTDLSLETVAREAWTDLDAPTASLEVETDCIVRAEESRLRRLFGNLFRNAVEHGGPDVTVRVGPGAGAVDDVDGGAPAGTAVAAETDRPATASESVEYSGFHVSDDGPGIPVEDRATVFETGYTTATTGTGMGLSIVEGIAEAHGWQVSLGDAPSGGLQVVLEGVEGRPVAGRDG
jgi:signal transduction histidine kinase